MANPLVCSGQYTTPRGRHVSHVVTLRGFIKHHPPCTLLISMYLLYLTTLILYTYITKKSYISVLFEINIVVNTYIFRIAYFVTTHIFLKIRLNF